MPQLKINLSEYQNIPTRCAQYKYSLLHEVVNKQIWFVFKLQKMLGLIKNAGDISVLQKHLYRYKYRS